VTASDSPSTANRRTILRGHRLRLGPGLYGLLQPHVGNIRQFTFRRNIFSSKRPNYRALGRFAMTYLT
jgi:hypothetical protein